MLLLNDGIESQWLFLAVGYEKEKNVQNMNIGFILGKQGGRGVPQTIYDMILYSELH